MGPICGGESIGSRGPGPSQAPESSNAEAGPAPPFEFAMMRFGYLLAQIWQKEALSPKCARLSPWPVSWAMIEKKSNLPSPLMSVSTP